MKTPKRTCRDCLFFTSYSSADPDGRCGEGCGTYGTHTRGSESACDAFMLSSAAKSARRKRKNRVSQLKRTIARLTQELRYEREYSRCFLAAYNRLARIVRNAKQITFACTDAEQLTERKEKE